MKNFLLISIISFLSINLFAQTSQGDEFYKLPVAEKLDYLYNNMLDKHIKDFKKLEDKIKDLESQLDKLNSGNLSLKNKKLLNDIEEKKTLLTELQNQLDSSNRLLTESDNSNNRMSNTISKLESQIKNEISLITKFEGIIDLDLLRSVESKAKENKISTKNLSKLIDLNQIIINAENVLSKPINENDINIHYTSLESISFFPSNWHQYKVSTLKYLLNNYCSITSEIYNSFVFLDDLGLDEHISSTRDDIENKRIVVINYPFLSSELEKKIKNINYKSKMSKCF